MRLLCLRSEPENEAIAYKEGAGERASCLCRTGRGQISVRESESVDEWGQKCYICKVELRDER